VRRIHFGELVDDDHVADHIESRASQLLGPRDPHQAQLSHFPDVLPRKGGVLVVLGGDGRDVIARELAHHLANLMVLLAEIQ
jgi:hypothetical protein